MLDFVTAVHDNFKAAITGDFGSFLADNTKLEPQDLGLNLYCLASDLRHVSGRAKHVDDINWLVDFVDAGINRFSEDDLPGLRPL